MDFLGANVEILLFDFVNVFSRKILCVFNLFLIGGIIVPRLYNWYIDRYKMSDGSEVLRAHGIVTGHDRLRDTTFINTSEVKEVTIENDIAIVQTRNTRYECSLESAKYESFEVPEVIPDFVVYRDRYSNLQKTKNNVLDKDGVLIALGNNREYYFDSIYVKFEGEEKYSDQVCPHIGMFQDSVLCRLNTKRYRIDYRYFPYPGLRVEFYEWMPEIDTYIENCGDEELLVTAEGKDYKIPPGEKKIIAPRCFS